jgi:tetratricopeptide (TPR) repeat protein
MADKQGLCIDILVNGHVQAYVDFFYLTHRPESAQPVEGTEHTEGLRGIPPAKLEFVKTQLAEAETARRRGDTAAVFAAYEGLAEFFTSLGDQRTAVYFLEKCLEITQLTSDVAGETKTTCALGVAHEKSGDIAAAVRHYEKLLRLAQGAGDEAAARQANERLVVAYQAVATEKEAAKEPQLALTFREKCLDASRACGDPAKEIKAQFELGQAHEKLGDISHLKKAVSHYENYLALAEVAEDTEAQGAACFALAHVHQRLQANAAPECVS